MDAEWAPVRAAVTGQREELDALVRDLLTRLQHEVPSYALVPPESVAALCRRNISTGLTAYDEGRYYTGDEIADIVSTVEARAQQGVPLDAVLNAFTIVESTSFACLERRLTDAGPDTMRRLWDMRFTNMEQLTRAVATVHRAVEIEQAAALQTRLVLALTELLTGGLTDSEGAATLSRLGMDPQGRYWVWSLRAADHPPHVLRHLAGGEARAPRAAFTLWDDHVVGLTAAPPPDHLADVEGGLAGPVAASEIHQAYREADQARRTAEAFGLPGVLTRREVALRSAVVQDPSVGEALRDKYLVPLASAGSLADELLLSVRVYLEHGSRRDAAARALHLHPNTLGYRLGRFAHFTGADLENHDVVAELWWLCRHLEVLERQPRPVVTPLS